MVAANIFLLNTSISWSLDATMYYLKGFIILILSLKVSAVPVDRTELPDVQINFPNDKAFAQEYLEKYGYNDLTVPFSAGSSYQEMIKMFQESAGLRPTGQLDKETMELMEAPRCGLGAVADQNRFNPIKWNKPELSYRVVRYSGKLSNNAIDRIVRQAMDFWEQAADIKFIRSRTRTVDIEIVFGSREHGDKLPFDGRSGVLAHAFFPGSLGGLAGDAHFDDDEDWSEITNVGKQLLQTTTHELGHSLGLGHSRVRGSVMYFAYPGWNPNLQLDRDDISRIRALYGRPSRTRNRPDPTSAPGKKSCTCDSFTRFDQKRRVIMGSCQSTYKGRLWCYIKVGAVCADSKRSSHVDKDWSWEACEQEQAGTPAPTQAPTPAPTRSPIAPREPGVKFPKSDPRGKCECNGITRYNSRLKENVGLCQSRYRGDFWCYVSSNSPCSDKKLTKRNEEGLMYWSVTACIEQTPFQVGDPFVDNSPFQVDHQVESQVVEEGESSP